jgi:hypothetical protein
MNQLENRSTACDPGPTATPALGMKPGCLQTAKRFIETTMDGDEQLDYVFHVQQCPDCRHYFETLSMMLMRRDRVREQLSKGGQH